MTSTPTRETTGDVARYHLARLFPLRNEEVSWVDATGRTYTAADRRASCRLLVGMARRSDERARA